MSLKNITLSAEESLIRRAREKASAEHTTVNKLFREWLEQYASRDAKAIAEDYRVLMEGFRYAKPGRKFTRDEMNER